MASSKSTAVGFDVLVLYFPRNERFCYFKGLFLIIENKVKEQECFLAISKKTVYSNQTFSNTSDIPLDSHRFAQWH